MDLILPLLIAFTIGYLVGSVPFGLIFTRFAGHGDIRQIGSGNIGATNVLRTGNKVLAAATLLADVLKGVAGCMIGPLVAWYAAGEAWQAMPALQTAGPNGYLLLAVTSYVAGLGAFIGHLFPAWLGFKGGKGVATYIGVLIGLVWPAALVFCGVWLAVAALTRYSSLSALVASLAAPLAAFWFQNATVGGVAAMMSVLLIVKHRPNIERLVNGEETRIGAKAVSEASSAPDSADPHHPVEG
jgi:glycerol-3-phosphate acyltransferase PlsY